MRRRTGSCSLSSELLVANLLRVAKEDLDGARLLGTANNRNAVSLCEQAAEKIIRAVLTTEGKHAGIKHLLNEMVDLVPDESPLKPYLRSMEHLAAYATAYRYPTAAGRIKQTPPSSDFTIDLQKVEAALLRAAAQFGVDLAKRDAPATNARPAR
jgi:HEPN domain-containing protein